MDNNLAFKDWISKANELKEDEDKKENQSK